MNITKYFIRQLYRKIYSTVQMFGVSKHLFIIKDALSDSKTFIMFQKISMSNKCSSFELFIHL